ncbi:MAG: toxic anion resistance protein [Bifidobacteriaceae bacterium]|jgi:uncharacterized protein YaaN involved in tellurite resistance|nr:toxic anion resistance protein [Bifidobacteriaceae bacterium]
MAEVATDDAAVVAAIPGVDMGSLLKGADSAVPQTPLEKALTEVAPADAAAQAPGEAKFQFRSLLSPDQVKALKTGAPALAGKMIGDMNAIIQFGEPVLTKMNAATVQLLDAQRSIRVPDADQLVNDLLREMDGFEKRFRNKTMEENVSKLKKWFKSTKYTVATLARESKPIVDKLDLAEGKLLDMENKLGENVTRGQLLHKQTLEHMDQVVAVLAALEEVAEVIRAEFKQADDVLAAATEGPEGEATSVEWKGEQITVGELREIHANLAAASSELGKTFVDWRQQLFMGFAHAPATRNLVLTQFSLRRRLQTFRTMGIPSARHSLALWQQSALARDGAEMGMAVQEGVNKMIRQSFDETAKTIGMVAEASQAPVISEETVWAVIDSVKRQCQAIVAADAAGRQLRERNVKALEAGEVTIKDELQETQRKLAQQALDGVPSEADSRAVEAKPAEDDLLGQMGIT